MFTLDLGVIMKKMNRRELFKYGAGLMAMVPFTSLVFAEGQKAEAAAACAATPAPEGVKVIDDKTSTRLDYVADATKSTNAKYTAGSACGNCKWYKADKPTDTWAKCSMAGNKFVTTCGWCKSYKANK